MTPHDRVRRRAERLGLMPWQIDRLFRDYTRTEVDAFLTQYDIGQREGRAELALFTVSALARAMSKDAGGASMGDLMGIDWEEEQYRLQEELRRARGEEPPSYRYLTGAVTRG